MEQKRETASTPAPADALNLRRARFLARQPILNVRQEVVAYELLFRTGWENAFSGDADDSSQRCGTGQATDPILMSSDNSIEHGVGYRSCVSALTLARRACAHHSHTLLGVLRPRTAALPSEGLGRARPLHPAGFLARCGPSDSA